MISARHLHEVEPVQLRRRPQLVGDDRLEVAVVDLGLLVRQLLERQERARQLFGRQLVAELLDA